MHTSSFRAILLAVSLLIPVAFAAGCSGGDRTEPATDGSVSGFAGRGAPESAPKEAMDAMAVGAPSAAMAPGAPPSPSLPQGRPSALSDSGVTGGGSAALTQSMLIRSGSTTIEVDSLEPAIANVRALTMRLGGFVANTSLQGGGEQLREAMLQLRIPANRFDDAISGLRAVGKVQRVDVSAEDVGEEFVDVTARVANAKRLESRLIELLARRTGKLEEVLAVERELARVREEIERYEGRLRYLRTRVAVSTLVVQLHEPAPLLNQPGTSPITDAFKQAWRNFVGFVAGFIAMLGILIPLGAIALLGVVLWLRFRPRTSRPSPPEGPKS